MMPPTLIREQAATDFTNPLVAATTEYQDDYGYDDNNPNAVVVSIKNISAHLVYQPFILVICFNLPHKGLRFILCPCRLKC
jgi:hypothetical protein